MSERLQIFDEIRLLLRGQSERTHAVVVRHDVLQRCRTPVVEVRRMLPEPTQRGRAVSLGRGACRVGPVDADIRGRVQLPAIVIGTAPADVAGRAGPVEEGAPTTLLS
jgi:hypothetical protein